MVVDRGACGVFLEFACVHETFIGHAHKLTGISLLEKAPHEAHTGMCKALA